MVADPNAGLVVGQRWAYRARQVDPYVEVELLRLGNRRPSRVLVRFVDSAAEGAEEWVTPKRLKVLWADVAERIARDQRWDRLHAEGGLTEVEDMALTWVLEPLLDSNVAEPVWSGRNGILSITDPTGLAALTGLAVEELDHPSAFVEDGAVFVPWPISQRVAIALLQANPDRVLEAVDEEERQARQEAIYGAPSQWDNGATIPPERCREFDAEHRAPIRKLVREWAGIQVIERFDELAALRTEVVRVGNIAESAIRALHAAGKTQKANDLRRQLGMRPEALEKPDGSVN